MPDNIRGRRFDVNWFLRAFHPKTATWVWGRSVNVSVSGILFLSPLKYDIGEVVQLDLTLNAHTTVRCLVRIVREGPINAGYHAYGASFKQFLDNGRQVLGDTLLAILRNEWVGEPRHDQPANPFGIPAVSSTDWRRRSA